MTNSQVTWLRYLYFLVFLENHVTQTPEQILLQVMVLKGTLTEPGGEHHTLFCHYSECYNDSKHTIGHKAIYWERKTALPDRKAVKSWKKLSETGKDEGFHLLLVYTVSHVNCFLHKNTSNMHAQVFHNSFPKPTFRAITEALLTKNTSTNVTPA